MKQLTEKQICTERREHEMKWNEMKKKNNTTEKSKRNNRKQRKINMEKAHTALLYIIRFSIFDGRTEAERVLRVRLAMSYVYM